MGITFDLCHALETGEVDNLLEKYGLLCVCNVHMADNNHQPFFEVTPELEVFLSGLHDEGYRGPVTLELAHGTTIEEVVKTKALFDKLVSIY